MRGGTAKDIQARRLMKKQKEKAIIDRTKIGKKNTAVMKMNWPGTEYGSLKILNQITFQMEHLISFNKLNG